MKKYKIEVNENNMSCIICEFICENWATLKKHKHLKHPSGNHRTDHTFFILTGFCLPWQQILADHTGLSRNFMDVTLDQEDDKCRKYCSSRKTDGTSEISCQPGYDGHPEPGDQEREDLHHLHLRGVHEF